MILIGLGSNLPSVYGDSRQTILAALRRLNTGPTRLTGQSRLWRTRPVPVSAQPWFINAVAAIETALPPDALLAHLHGIELEFGRTREERNAARSLDLDILDYNGLISAPGRLPILPHPRLETRGFVLLPLAEIAPGWQHPVTGAALEQLIAALPQDQAAEICDD